MLEAIAIGGLLVWLLSSGSGTSQSFRERFRGKVDTYKRSVTRANEKARIANSIGVPANRARYYREAASLAHTAVTELSAVYEGLRNEINTLQSRVDRSSGKEKGQLIQRIKPLRNAMHKLKNQVAYAKQFRNSMNARCANGGKKATKSRRNHHHRSARR